MSADEFSDYTTDDVIKLMVACGASKDFAKTTVTAQATKLDTALKKLAEHSFNNIPTTTPKVVVGHFHFRLRKAITNSIKLASSLLTAGIGLVAFPVLPAVGAGAAALGGASAVSTAIDTISDLFTKMTDEELYVYHSILNIANNDRQKNTDVAKNLTVDRLKKWFTDHYEAPPRHLDAILVAMQRKGIQEQAGTKRKQNTALSIRWRAQDMECVPGHPVFIDWCGHGRLIVASPPNPEHDELEEHLIAQQSRLRISASIFDGDVPETARLSLPPLFTKVFPRYYLIEAPLPNIFNVINGLYRSLGNPDVRARIDNIEPDQQLNMSAQVRIGTNFSLTAGQSSHAAYKSYLNAVNPTTNVGGKMPPVDGTGVRIRSSIRGSKPASRPLPATRTS